MPTLDDVYRKFGEVSEAAQIVETSLGTMLMFFGLVEEKLLSPTTLKVDDVEAANDLVSHVNRQTLGQLLKNTKRHTDALDKLEPTLANALDIRNRLSHSFYRQHNFRKNTNAGRSIMMNDLEARHKNAARGIKGA